MLQFEGWWMRLGPGGSRQKCSVHITYHTDTEPAAFFVRWVLSQLSRGPDLARLAGLAQHVGAVNRLGCFRSLVQVGAWGDASRA